MRASVVAQLFEGYCLFFCENQILTLLYQTSKAKAMETKKKRLALDLDSTFQRRLKDIAAFNGVSKRGYWQAAIDRELTRDEANRMVGLLSDKPDHELFAELRQEIFGGKPLPGSSADLFREAREIRNAEFERWA